VDLDIVKLSEKKKFSVKCVCRQSNCRQNVPVDKMIVGNMVVDKVIVGQVIVGQVYRTHLELSLL